MVYHTQIIADNSQKSLPLYIAPTLLDPLESIFLNNQDIFLLNNLVTMKYAYRITALALVASEVAAFPSAVFNREVSEEQERAINRIAADIEASGKTKRAGLPGAPGFNAEQQYVSTSGDYAFVAPTSSDLRGPCPGLNAMANHGYIPHNGVASIPEFIQGTYDGE